MAVMGLYHCLGRIECICIETNRLSYIYIHIYIERERETDRQTKKKEKERGQEKEKGISNELILSA